MRNIVFALLLVFVMSIIPACTGSKDSSIDLSKLKTTMQKSSKTQKDIDEAKKSIFPNMK